jgi:hypothetical protein
VLVVVVAVVAAAAVAYQILDSKGRFKTGWIEKKKPQDSESHVSTRQ